MTDYSSRKSGFPNTESIKWRGSEAPTVGNSRLAGFGSAQSLASVTGFIRDALVQIRPDDHLVHQQRRDAHAGIPGAAGGKLHRQTARPCRRIPRSPPPARSFASPMASRCSPSSTANSPRTRPPTQVRARFATGGSAAAEPALFMSALGQKRKDLSRANVVRFTPISGHLPTRRPCPLSAKSRHSRGVRPWGRTV
jgi:hypothetical protein